MSDEFIGTAEPYTDADVEAIAQKLKCSTAAVYAVADNESGSSGFLPSGKPKLLFESHYFHLKTNGQYDEQYPDLSTPTWVRNYGAGGEHQYDRLEQAIALNREAALRSASWGAFQVMGDNFAVCGYSDVEEFVKAMVQNGGTQLEAFGGFCLGNHLDQYLQQTPPDFASFAYHYNGPGYAANGYDVKMAAAWRKHMSGVVSTPNPVPRTDPDLHYSTLQEGDYGDPVKVLQGALMAKGFNVTPDGDFGPATKAALVNWQARTCPPADGIFGPATAASLGLDFPL